MTGVVKVAELDLNMAAQRCFREASMLLHSGVLRTAVSVSTFAFFLLWSLRSFLEGEGVSWWSFAQVPSF